MLNIIKTLIIVNISLSFSIAQDSQRLNSITNRDGDHSSFLGNNSFEIKKGQEENSSAKTQQLHYSPKKSTDFLTSLNFGEDIHFDIQKTIDFSEIIYLSGGAGNGGDDATLIFNALAIKGIEFLENSNEENFSKIKSDINNFSICFSNQACVVDLSLQNEARQLNNYSKITTRILLLDKNNSDLQEHIILVDYEQWSFLDYDCKLVISSGTYLLARNHDKKTKENIDKCEKVSASKINESYDEVIFNFKSSSMFNIPEGTKLRAVRDMIIVANRGVLDFVTNDKIIDPLFGSSVYGCLFEIKPTGFHQKIKRGSILNINRIEDATYYYADAVGAREVVVLYVDNPTIKSITCDQRFFINRTLDDIWVRQNLLSHPLSIGELEMVLKNSFDIEFPPTDFDHEGMKSRPLHSNRLWFDKDLKTLTDPSQMHFRGNAQDAIFYLEKNQEMNEDFNFNRLKDIANEVAICFNNNKCILNYKSLLISDKIKDRIGLSKVAINITREELTKSGLSNIPKYGVILVDSKRWFALTPECNMAIAGHEVLGINNLDRSFQISSALLDGKIDKCKAAAADILEVPSITTSSDMSELTEDISDYSIRNISNNSKLHILNDIVIPAKENFVSLEGKSCYQNYDRLEFINCSCKININPDFKHQGTIKRGVLKVTGTKEPIYRDDLLLFWDGGFHPIVDNTVHIFVDDPLISSISCVSLFVDHEQRPAIFAPSIKDFRIIFKDVIELELSKDLIEIKI